MKDIIMYGDPILREVAEPISEFDYGIKLNEWFTKLFKVYKDLGSPKGLAAPQVGIFKQLILCRFKKGTYTVMVNPCIVKQYCSKKSNEGCESSGLTRYIVNRPRFGKVEYRDMEGSVHKKWFGWKKLRVICHEVDHLNGLYLPDVGKEWKRNGKR